VAIQTCLADSSALVQVDFQTRVDVGDLLSFQSLVVHTRNLLDHPDGPRGQVFVQVEAHVNRPEQITSYTSNTFNFTCALCFLTTLQTPFLIGCCDIVTWSIWPRLHDSILMSL
jgi:hypothetical protein